MSEMGPEFPPIRQVRAEARLHAGLAEALVKEMPKT